MPRNDIQRLPVFSGPRFAARRGIEIRRVDLEDMDSLSPLLAGVDAVVNTSMPPPSREPELVTNIYHACNQAGVRRFIQLSSAAVYGNRTGEVSESMSPAPLDDYGRGKVGNGKAPARGG